MLILYHSQIIKYYIIVYTYIYKVQQIGFITELRLWIEYHGYIM